MSKLNTIFFDLDGTLLDTAPDLIAALNLLLSEEGKNSVSLAQMSPLVSQGAVAMILEAFSINKEHSSLDDYRKRFLKIYSQNLATHTRLFPAMESVLGYLESAEIPWGVVTNKHERFALPLLEELNLLPRVCCVVGGDTTEHSKPHPAPLLHACTLSKTTPERSMYIGDAKKDIIAGKAAGMQTVAAAYGYVDTKPEEWNADHLVIDCNELLLLLQKELSVS